MEIYPKNTESMEIKFSGFVYSEGPLVRTDL